MKGKTQRRQTLESSSLNHTAENLQYLGAEVCVWGGLFAHEYTRQPRQRTAAKRHARPDTRSSWGPQGTSLPDRRGATEILSPNTERRERSTAGSLTGKPAMAHPLRWLPVRLNTLPWENEPGAERASVRWEPEAPGRSRRGSRSPRHVVGSRLAFGPGAGQQASGQG